MTSQLGIRAPAESAGTREAREEGCRRAFVASGVRLFLLAACLFLAPERAEAGRIIGMARVLDADTIEIYGMHIRLARIDAPEARQLCQQDSRQWRCGEAAMEALTAYVARRLVTCIDEDVDRLGRTVAVCYVASRDLNSWLVAEGWAMNEPGSSTYLAEEDSARAARRGVWSSRFVVPWNLATGLLNAGAE